MTDLQYMKQAVALAARGSGWVNPNPQVGAVIVKGDCIIGEGYHKKYGLPHAEREALSSCKGSPQGATLYVTLEPCCHTAKTPPCVDALIASGISRVVVGSNDPNPLVAGKGISRLRAAGIEVKTGCLKQECDTLNKLFFHYILHNVPYVLLKYAMTLDGKIATRLGASKWITGTEARADVQAFRARYAAIMVGIGTVLADDPLLNCRHEGAHTPLRVICDSLLRIPLDSQIVQTASHIPTLIATTTSKGEKFRHLKDAGCEMLTLEGLAADNLLCPERAAADSRAAAERQFTQAGEHVDLVQLMQELGKRQIDSLLIEGGPTIHGSALDAGIVQAVRCYVAPKFFGGKDAPSPVAGCGVALPEEALALKEVSITSLGSDICIEGEVE